MSGTVRPHEATEELGDPPVVVLVAPQLGENIGAAARVMSSTRPPGGRARSVSASLGTRKSRWSVPNINTLSPSRSDPKR